MNTTFYPLWDASKIKIVVRCTETYDNSDTLSAKEKLLLTNGQHGRVGRKWECKKLWIMK